MMNTRQIRFSDIVRWHAPFVLMTLLGVLVLSSCAVSGRADQPLSTSASEPSAEETTPVVSGQKYAAWLPSTDFERDVEAVNRVSDTGVLSETASPATDDLQITPILLLDKNYTIQIGLYDSHQSAAEQVGLHQLTADEAGIAEVVIDGKKQFLLAYGVYLYEADAKAVAENLSDRIGLTLTVRRLSEIEALSTQGN